MGLPRELGEALAEAAGAKAFGPNWREKKQQEQGAIMQQQANLVQTGAETEGIGLRNQGASLALQDQEMKLAEAKRLIDAKKAQIAAGTIPDDGKTMAQEYIWQQKQRELEVQKAQAGIAQQKSSTAANYANADQSRAQSELYRAKANAPAAGVDLTGSKWITDSQGRNRLISKHGADITDQIGDRSGVQPPPTADQRNSERYDVALPVLFDQIQGSLDNLKGKGWLNAAEAAVPGTEANMALEEYRRQLMGYSAILGRALGDNRITDADRPVYASLFGISSRLAATPPGTALAQRLLDNARQLQTTLAKSRSAAAAGTAGPGLAISHDSYQPGAGTGATIVSRRRVTGVQKVSD